MSYPTCLVEIYGRDEQWTLTADVSEGRPYGLSPGSDLLSCTTTKHMHYGNPAGEFSLTLVYQPDSRGRTWADRIFPQDLVVIQMMNHGQKLGPHGQGQQHTVMIGLVTNVREAGGVGSDGTPRRNITVSGKDFGKLFERGNVTYWSFAGASQLGAAEFIPQHMLNDQPHRVVQRLLTDLFFKFMRPEWVFNSSTVRFEDVIGLALTSYQAQFPGGLDWQFILSEQAFWSFFIKTASVPFHEIYIDTRRTADMGHDSSSHPLGREPVKEVKDYVKDAEGFFNLQSIRTSVPSDAIVQLPAQTYGADKSAPFLIFRPPPFPSLSPDRTVTLAPWDNLPEHIFSMDVSGFEAQAHEVGRDDSESFNLYLVYPRGGVLGDFQYLLNVPPLMDEQRFKRYGYRPLMPHVDLLMMPESSGGSDSWLNFYNTLMWQLAGWNVLNDHYYSGSIAYPLIPHVHVGERLLNDASWQPAYGVSGSGRQYYIESVRHEFIANTRATTRLGVTRGLHASEAEVYDSLIQGQAGQLTEIGLNARQKYIDIIRKGQLAPYA